MQTIIIIILRIFVDFILMLCYNLIGGDTIGYHNQRKHFEGSFGL